MLKKDNVIFRKYCESDKKILLDMLNGSLYHEYLEEDNLSEIITIALIDGKHAGFSYISIYSGLARVFVYVIPEFRGNGIGTMLYQRIAQQTADSSCETIWSTFYSKEESMKFVEKVGYDLIEGNDFMVYPGGLLPEKDFEIRKLRNEDFSVYSLIEAYAWHELRVRTGQLDSKPVLPTAEDIEKALAEPDKENDNAFVLIDKGIIVGGGSISEDAGKYSINSVCVDTEKYNRGYGKALSVFLTNEVLRRGKNAVYLNVEHGNDNARHIYESIGYKTMYTGYSPIKKIK